MGTEYTGHKETERAVVSGLAVGAKEVSRIRRYEANDIARRITVISPKDIRLTNYPLRHPVTAFNPSLYVEGDEVRLFMRVTVGYYRYASAIAFARLGLDTLLSSKKPVVLGEVKASLVVHPSTSYDIWGVEDPRVYSMDGKLYMTYTGRTISYFDINSVGRTAPITAVSRDGGFTWKKSYIHLLPHGASSLVISDKNAFMYDVDGERLFFHRLHTVGGQFFTVISRVEESSRVSEEGLRELVSKDTVVAIERASFESKNGWAAPPIRLGKDYIVLLHGVDKRMSVYRVFAMLIEYSRSDGIVVKAVTPRYIMKPRELYEVYGDRPYVVFPCGVVRVDSTTLLLSYGAADQFVGIAAIDLNELLSELDRGRIY